MLKIEKFYVDAIARCEILTEDVVANTNAVMLSINLIEDTFLNAGRAVTAATRAAAHLNPKHQPVSLPAVMLEKEVANLMLSLSELKSTVKNRLGSTLQHLNQMLTEAAADMPVTREESASQVYTQYRQTLLKCITILERLEDHLFQHHPWAETAHNPRSL